jgi:hypothetical protein
MSSSRSPASTWTGVWIAWSSSAPAQTADGVTQALDIRHRHGLARVIAPTRATFARRLPLGHGEPSGELQGRVRDPSSAEGLCVLSRCRERDHVTTPVVGVPLSLDVAGPLEIVDQGHHCRAVDAQPLSDRLLRECASFAVGLGLMSEEGHDTEVLDGEPERLERAVGDLLSVFGSPAEDRADTTM